MSRSDIVVPQYGSVEARLTKEEAHDCGVGPDKIVSVKWIRNGVYKLTAKAYVGTMLLGSGRSLVVEPRVPVGVLFALIAEVYGIYTPKRPIFQEDHASYSVVEALFEFVIERFVAEVEEIAASGLLRDYENVIAEERSIRGRLLVAEAVRRPLSSARGFPCRYEVLTADLPENRVLRLAVVRLSAGTYRLAHLSERLWHLDRAMTAVPLDDDAADLLDDILFHRLNERYRAALALARLLLAHLSHSGNVGEAAFRGFRINMDTLFERYLGAVLKRSLEPRGLRVRLQSSSRLDHGEEFSIRPDIVVEHDRRVVAVLDAKDKTEPKEQDIYQMLTYCLCHDLREGILVYPTVDGARQWTVDVIGSSGICVHIHLLDLSGDTASLLQETERLARLVEMVAAPQAIS